MLGAGEHLDLVLDVVLFQQALQLARDVRRHAAVGLGEGVIEFALDPVEEQMRRILLVGDDADPVERGGRCDPMREDRRRGGDVLAAHAIADAADRAGLGLVLRVEKAEQPAGVVHHHRVRQAVHRAENAPAIASSRRCTSKRRWPSR